MNTTNLLRASAFAVAAALATSLTPTDTHAAAPMVKKSAPGYYRIMLGDFEVTALSDGTVALPMDKLLTNTSPAKIAAAFKKYYVTSPVETSVTIKFDSDSKAAAQQRKQAYADAAKNGTLVGATHVSFPGLGRLRASGSGYIWVPINYVPLR